jgi:hypothetical protein
VKGAQFILDSSHVGFHNAMTSFIFDLAMLLALGCAYLKLIERQSPDDDHDSKARHTETIIDPVAGLSHFIHHGESTRRKYQNIH